MVSHELFNRAASILLLFVTHVGSFEMNKNLRMLRKLCPSVSIEITSVVIN